MRYNPEMRFVALAATLLAGGGCSWLTVAGPPPTPYAGAPAEAAPTGPPDGCTRERFAPTFDAVSAGIFGAGAAIAMTGGAVILATAHGDDYNQFFGGMLLGAGVLYAAFAIPFALSARSGYRDVAACRNAYLRWYGSIDGP